MHLRSRSAPSLSTHAQSFLRLSILCIQDKFFNYFGDATLVVVGFCDVVLSLIHISEPNLDFLRHNRLIKILYMSKDFEYLKELEKKMRPMTTEVDTTFSSDLYLEFNAKGISKGAALMRLAAYLGIKPEETIAVGDSHNDVEMIEAAGLGVYMANADEALKPHANYITKANNNEGGVAEVIEKFILNA